MYLLSSTLGRYFVFILVFQSIPMTDTINIGKYRACISRISSMSESTQCDQIGLFLIDLSYTFSRKSSQNV